MTRGRRLSYELNLALDSVLRTKLQKRRYHWWLAFGQMWSWESWQW